jgi:hypothetical protein
MSNSKSDGLLSDITKHVAGIFRHILPGVLVVGAAGLAYPNWFGGIDLKSWPHIIIIGVITLAVGNTWFALNRYGLHQGLDYLLYLKGWGGPAKTAESSGYLDDLGRYVSKSQHLPEASARAQEHVALRASTVLLILTLGEVSIVFGICHRDDSCFKGHEILMVFGGLSVLFVGLWQMAITRFIDNHVVNRQ